MSDYLSNDTIAAVATSLAGDSGVGIIRISGSNSIKIAKLVSTGLDFSSPRTLHRIQILEPSTQKILDDGLGVFFEYKKSFTGEQSVEFQLHGGRFLLQYILKTIIDTGFCRLALPGEFSFRALKTGKISFSEAESINKIITSKSIFEIDAIRKNFSKNKLQEYEDLVLQILELLAKTELSIDFIDQDVEVLNEQNLKIGVDNILLKVNDLFKSADVAIKLSRGISVTIAGEPNAGKSTLFNSILSEERAIVSEIPGTTRDVISEEILVGKYRVRLSDTAGIRETFEKIEKEGIERAERLLSESELVLYVIDGTINESVINSQISILNKIKEKTIFVLNKADKVNKEKVAKIKFDNVNINLILVSAKSQNGISDLVDLVRKTLDSRYNLTGNEFLPSEFQLQMLIRCKDAATRAKEILYSSKLKHPELISAELQIAANALSDLVGKTTPDTILNKIFSEYCIGK